MGSALAGIQDPRNLGPGLEASRFVLRLHWAGSVIPCPCSCLRWDADSAQLVPSLCPSLFFPTGPALTLSPICLQACCVGSSPTHLFYPRLQGCTQAGLQEPAECFPASAHPRSQAEAAALRGAVPSIPQAGSLGSHSTAGPGAQPAAPWLQKGPVLRGDPAPLPRLFQVRAAAYTCNPGLLCVACGSYRRGKPTCGDVDVLITHPDGRSHRGVFSRLLDGLRQQGTLAVLGAQLGGQGQIREEGRFSQHSGLGDGHPRGRLGGGRQAGAMSSQPSRAARVPHR